MTILSYHPLLQHRSRQGSRKLAVLLFCGGLIWVGALVFLFFSPLAGMSFALGLQLPAWLSITHSTLAYVTTALLGVIAVTTLIAQMRGYQVPGWVPLLFALCLTVVLWWVW